MSIAPCPPVAIVCPSIARGAAENSSGCRAMRVLDSVEIVPAQPRAGRLNVYSVSPHMLVGKQLELNGPSTRTAIVRPEAATEPTYGGLSPPLKSGLGLSLAVGRPVVNHPRFDLTKTSALEGLSPDPATTVDPTAAIGAGGLKPLLVGALSLARAWTAPVQPPGGC